MNLDERIDLRRYVVRIFWLFVAATAARYSAERDAVAAFTGVLLWTFAFLLCAILRPAVHAPGKPGRIEAAGNVVAGIGMLMAFLEFAVGGILPALLVLLYAMLCALFLIAEKRVHLWLILAASFVAVVFAAAESRSPFFLLWAAWFTIAALGLMTFDSAQHREQSAQARPVDGARLSRGGTVVALITLAVALPLYLFVPTPPGLKIGGMTATTAHDYAEREGADPAADGDAGMTQAQGGGRRPVTPRGGASGSPRYGDDFDITAVQRNAQLANVIVMFVKSSEPVYLRGKLFDRFAGNRWTRDTQDRSRRGLDRGYFERVPPVPRGTPVTQVVEVQEPLDESVYAAAGLTRLRFPAPMVYENADGTLDLPQPLRRDTTYSVESDLRLAQARYLQADERLAPAARERYLQLPADLSPRIAVLAAAVAGARTDPVETALALETHLRENYAYSFQSVFTSQGVTPLDEFLFGNRRGHCEYFASALAVMLRTQGIPARLATGYSLGEPNPVTGFHEVRVLDGHAWVEAHIADRGWLMLEPTPFYPVPQTGQPQEVAGKLDRYLERQAQNLQVLAPGSVKTVLLTLAQDAWSRLRHVQKQLLARLGAIAMWLPALALAAALLLAAIRLLLLARRDRRDARAVRRLLAQADAPGAGPNATLCAAEALEACLAPRDAPRAPGATFREYYATLLRLKPGLAADFAGRFEAQRYGPGGAPAAADAQAIRALVERELAAQPLPRVARQVASWRAALTALLPRRR